MITAYSILSSVPFNGDNAAFHLNECNFPPAKWIHLAVGLKQADAISDIEAKKEGLDGHLVSLIIHWVANDLNSSWQNLLDAMVISKERNIANLLADRVGVPRPGKNNN